METRNRSNSEFRVHVGETFARHEANFDRINATLETILMKLQAIECRIPNFSSEFNNPFPNGESSQNNNAIQTTNQNITAQATQHITKGSNLKLHFPKFTGEDPNGWIYRAEQYFEFQNITATHKVQLASFHLEGIALQWHRWHAKFKGPLLWDEFTKAILHRFGPTEFDDPSEALTRLRQNSTIDVYQHEFERISQLIDGLPEKHLIGSFLAGLKDEVRLDVKILKPQTLSEAIGLSRLIEERNAINGKAIEIDDSSPTNVAHCTNYGSTPFKKITGQEARVRKEKGLCYYCDEKYIPGHRCQRPQLYMIEDIKLYDTGQHLYPCGQG